MTFNPNLPNGLSHPYQLNESIFHFWCIFFIFIIFLIEIPVSKQCRPWSDALIWVCTICLCPKNGTPGLYGLIRFGLQRKTKQKKFLLANSVDPDQTPRSAASDPGLHYLSMSQKWDARLILVNQIWIAKKNKTKVVKMSFY